MLKLVDIRKTFNPGTVNEKKALNGLNLTLKEGDFVTVIGGNGAGKSTMLNAIAGVWPVDEGEILIDGINVTKLSEHKRAKYLGRVFQDPMTGTAATMEIEENMALAARRGLRRTLKSGINEAERERYKEKLKILDLGLENRLTAAVREADSLDDLYTRLKTKRYPHARLRRLVLDAALGFPAELPMLPYLHVLGARKTALPRLKQAQLPAATALADLARTSPEAAKISRLHNKAVDFSSLCREKIQPMGLAFTAKPVVI